MGQGRIRARFPVVPGLTAANYAISYADGGFTVNQAPLTATVAEAVAIRTVGPAVRSW